MKLCPVVPCRRTDRRTDMTKLIVAFPNFENSPKNNIQPKQAQLSVVSPCNALELRVQETVMFCAHYSNCAVSMRWNFLQSEDHCTFLYDTQFTSGAGIFQSV